MGKRVVDFLLVLIELFATCYGWVATSENSLKIGCCKNYEKSVKQSFLGRFINITALYY